MPKPLLLWAMLALAGWASPRPAAADSTLLNVSYDATHELYADFDRAFIADWKARTGETIAIRTSHGGSAVQARAVTEGLEADVVTLGLQPDIDAIARTSHLLPEDWRGRLPNNSVPYTSTILFVVRRGNPKGIHDWSDLVRPGITVITPNPKTSGGARWNYLAAYGYALRQPGATPATARDFLRALFANTPVLDSGARGSTISFARRHLGDVLLAWEDDANLAVRYLSPGKIEIVVPSVSIKAEPVVAVVDSIVHRHHTGMQAEAYLRALYTPQGQEIIARHFYRPIDPAVLARHADIFPPVPTFTVDDLGGWAKVNAEHFAEGGVFDQIYQPLK